MVSTGNGSEFYEDSLSRRESVRPHDFTYTVTSQRPDLAHQRGDRPRALATSPTDVVTDTEPAHGPAVPGRIDLVKERARNSPTAANINPPTRSRSPTPVSVDCSMSSSPTQTVTRTRSEPATTSLPSMAVDEVWRFTCTHLVTEHRPVDPYAEHCHVVGDTSEGEGRNEVDRQGSHEVDLIHPAIEIVKMVDQESARWTTVTFTYVVTNTGDTTLFDISVDDDILGPIGDIPELAPGDPATLTNDCVLRDETSPTSAPQPARTSSQSYGERQRRRHGDPIPGGEPAEPANRPLPSRARTRERLGLYHDHPGRVRRDRGRVDPQAPAGA